MAERNYVGELELMILLSVVRLGEEAYGVPIAREIEKQVGREVTLGSVYAALERLEARGMVGSRMGESTAERGGKAKRYFRVTKVGLRQLQETRRVLQQMWRGLPTLRGENL